MKTFLKGLAALPLALPFISTAAARADSYYSQDLFSDIFDVLAWVVFDMALAARFILFLIAFVIILKIFKKI